MSATIKLPKITKIPEKGRTLAFACYSGNVQLAEEILENDPGMVLEEDPSSGATPLHYSLARSSLRTAQLLVEQPLLDEYKKYKDKLTELAKRAQNYPISTILIEKQIINNNYVNNNVSPIQVLNTMNNNLYVGLAPAALQGFKFVHMSERKVIVNVPLEYTANGAGVGFGGSLATVCAVAGASLASNVARIAGIKNPNSFCKTASLQYLNKVDCEYYIACATVDENMKNEFETNMEMVGKDDLTVHVDVINDQDVICVSFDGIWTVNDPKRSKRGNKRYSKYDLRVEQGYDGGGGSSSKL